MQLPDPPANATPPRDPSMPPPGREREWDRLTDRLVDALRGRGGVITLSGEAGVGKTTLATALASAARRQGAVVLVGGCYDLALTPSYGPWSEAVRSNRSDDVAPPPSAVVTDGSDDGSTMLTTSRLEVFEQVGAWLATIAARQPVVVILEDVQWADAASLDLVRFIGRHLTRLPVLLVITWRDGEGWSPAPFTRILPAIIRETQPLRLELQRLGTAGVRDLIAERYRLADDDLDALAGWIQRSAEGNPFFTGEVLLALEQAGALKPDGDHWSFSPPTSIAVPPLVRHVIEQRLALLPATTQVLLEYAAIIGQDVPLSLLQAASDATDDDLVGMMDDALASQIVTETASDDDQLHFRHALMRETLYQRQNALRRRARHRRIAETLLAAATPAPVAVAHHLRAAHDPRAIEWLVRAGEASLAHYAPHDAVAFLTQATDVATRCGGALPMSALRTRGQAWEMVGDVVRARADYEEVLRASRAMGDRRAEWQALLDLGSLWAERDYRRAGEAFHRALALAREDLDETAVADSLNAVGNWHVNNEEPHRAITCHEDALALFTRLSDRHRIAATGDLLALARYVAGDVRGAAQDYARVVALLDELGERQLLVSALTNWSTTGGNFETDAVVTADGAMDHWFGLNARANTIAREIGWAAGQSYAQIQAGAIRAARGQMGDALRLAGAGMAIAERIGHQQWIVCGHVALGRMYSDVFDLEQARDHLEAAYVQAQTIASPYWTALAAAELAMLLIEDGDLDRAAAIAEAGLSGYQHVQSTGQRRCRLAWAWLMLARGEAEQALETTSHLVVTAPHAAGPRSLPWLALVRGQALHVLGRLNEAEEEHRAARRGALDRDDRHLLWRVDVALGHLLHDTGRIDEARSTFDRALTMVDDLALTLPTDDLRRSFRRGVDARLPRTSILPKATPDAIGLSPREIDVLRLVAVGLTDADVGEQLSISRRTVGRHLESIYNKLGVGSRTAAASVAYEHGLIDRSTNG